MGGKGYAVERRMWRLSDQVAGLPGSPQGPDRLGSTHNPTFHELYDFEEVTYRLSASVSLFIKMTY